MKFVDGGWTFAATDISDHLGCDHLSNLNRLEANGAISRPEIWDPLLDILAERGRVHELAYLEFLRGSGRSIAQPDQTTSTLDLMRQGIDVVFQAPLRTGNWHGRADFLLRVERPSQLGAWSYDVTDTKLAAETRAGAVLQLCVYSDLVGVLQGVAPEHMHVVRPGPDFPRDTYRFAEYAAIYRRLRDDLEQHSRLEPPTYPEPVPHCEVCRWRTRCDQQRRSDDHLSLVADLGRRHQRELIDHNIPTVGALASEHLPLRWKPERGAASTYDRLARQAKLQVAARTISPPPIELFPVEPERGLARLPAPTSADVFLDLEGDPFIGGHGREYLFGYVTVDGGKPTYTGYWAFDDQSELQAFEKVVADIIARWTREPGMHVYHYAPYEVTAFKRLRGHYGTSIEHVDRLLRGERFVDLHSVTRQALLAGVETYSIKSLEPIIGFKRALPLEQAGRQLRGVLRALQRGARDAIPSDWLDDVRTYNMDDCLSALALRDWLETKRSMAVDMGAQIERPPLRDGSPAEARAASDAAAQAIADRLLVGIPLDEAERTPEQQGRWLLGHSIFWYARELAPEYWDYFRRLQLSEDDRLDDPKCISGLAFDREISPAAGRRSAVHRYRFPPQDVLLDGDATLYVDAATRLGSVDAVDLDAFTVDIKKAKDQTATHPLSVVAMDVVRPAAKQDAIRTLAGRVADSGFPPANQRSLARDLLLRAPTRLGSGTGPVRGVDEPAVACALRIARELDGTLFAIQGPPGSGKTFVATKMILELVRAGRRVGITATSHKVIHNLVERLVSSGTAMGLTVGVLVKIEHGAQPTPGTETTTDAATVERDYSRYDVIAGTPWLWARPGLTDAVDTLFVDEAGQMSLVDTLAISGSASNMVLLGDPQQLQQPIKGTHPDGLAVSALAHLLAGRDTIPPERGLFLDETWRLHPSICGFTSAQFYEDRLKPGPDVEKQRINAGPLHDPGLYWVPVEHHGNQNRSREEAAVVATLVHQLLEKGTWTAPSGPARPLTAIDLRIVAPYNAHVGMIREALGELAGVVPVGTVDKFQGQEGAVAIYSMATSHPDDAPRGLDFLYDRHRLNVATSRARCASVLVCSPSLLRPSCKTPHHLQLASGMAAFVQTASYVRLEPKKLSIPNAYAASAGVLSGSMGVAVHEILKGIQEVEGAYHRLVLVVGAARTGKTEHIVGAGSALGLTPINVNLLLAERLLDLSQKQRLIGVAGLLDEIVKAPSTEVVLLDNIEMLFAVELKQDPLRLLQGLSRNRTIVASWPGTFENNTLTYAAPGHPEFRKYAAPQALIVRMVAQGSPEISEEGA